jgi:hypothetical protein
MYNPTKTKSEEILRLYKEGKMLTEITQLTSSSQPTVKKVLSQFGIDYDEDRKKSREETLKKVVELYQEGKSQIYIEQTLKLTRKTIRELLKSVGVDYRDLSDQHHIRHATEINHQAFDELTPEALYWIGMMYTDGHISQTREASLELTLHDNDEPHLEKFRQFLGCNRKVINGHDSKRLRVNSRRLRDRLVELGFTSNKSTSIAPHELLKQSRDFWRGCIDGDGGLYKHPSGSKTISHIFLCGTLETIFDFILYCSQAAGVKEKYPTKAPGKNFYRVSYYGQDARKIATLLYKDATVYLDRKYQTYLTEFADSETEAA